MRIGNLEAIRRIFRLGKDMHPDFDVISLKHRVLLIAQALVSLPNIRKWYEISDNPLLVMVIQRFPLMNGMIYWPYINYTWPMEQRLAVIDTHFRLLEGSAAVIAHATFKDIEIARVDEYAGLRLVLDKTEWFLREGEIILNLFVNDQRFYSIVFTLGIDNDQPLAYVGALQGSNSESAQDVYREITHALHGMRPRDFLMTVLKLFCKELRVERLWAIANDNRHHNSPYFGGANKEKLFVDYNNVWVEHGGRLMDNGFFEIPVTVNYKEMSEIPTRKRANYRRRYQMLDRLALDIRSCCSKYSDLPTAASSTPINRTITQINEKSLS